MALSGNIVKEYLKRFSKTGNKTLAAKIYKENKEAFKDMEHVRSIIRYHRGAMGKNNKIKLIDKSMIQDNSEFRANPYRIPKGDKNDYTPYQIPKANKHILVFSDVHIPFHNAEALEIMVKDAKEKEVDTILINGDFMDFYQLSRFIKDPRERSVKYELETAREILNYIRHEFPDQLIIFKEGNHDERLENWLRIKAPELLDIEEFRLESLLKMQELNIIHVKEKKRILAGKLNILHGHEFGHSVFAPVNPARGFYLRSKTNVLAGHHHQVSNHIESNLNEEQIGAWSTGCMCDMHPKYMPINKWATGWAYVRITDERGNFRVDNLQLINDKIY